VGTVAAGQCTLTSTSAGAKTLTATYAGDANFSGSISAEGTGDEPHAVNAADTTTTIVSDTPDPSTTGQSVTVSYSVAVNSPGVGTPTGTVTVTDADSAATCNAAVSAGSCSLTFTTTGTHHLTATYGGSADFNGSASAAETHSVTGTGYTWSGFFAPVNNLPTLNSVKSGSAIPVKFSLGGNQGLSIFAAGSPYSQKISCSSGVPIDAIEQTVNAGGSSLTYDSSTGQYNYVWKTDKSWAGTCRQLTMVLNDGSMHQANFQFK
jgi:hypothetical protein